MTNAPCYTCTHRSVGCHNECEAYKTWAAEERKQTLALRKLKEDSIAAEQFMYASIELVKEKKRKGHKRI